MPLRNLDRVVARVQRAGKLLLGIELTLGPECAGHTHDFLKYADFTLGLVIPSLGEEPG